MTIYTWEFPTLKVMKSQNNLTNVVVSVNWRLCAQDESYKFYKTGVATFGEPSPTNFVDFSTIDNDIIVSWLNSSIDVDVIKAELDEQISNAKTSSFYYTQVPKQSK